MANRYANLVGTKKISEDFNTINIGFDRVQAEMDTKGTPADAQAKADAAKAAAIATAAEALTAHKARGADEHPTAKGNAAGFMSAADKLKSDASTNVATPDTLMQRDAEGRAKVTAPVEADDIARKAETDAVQSNLESHAADTDIHVTAADHDKLDGIAAGAEVNQNAFSKVNDVAAGDPSDTVTFVGGTGITITTDPANKRVSFTATGEATPGPHALSHIQGGTDVIPNAETGGVSGLMSGADAQFVREDGETKLGAQAKADAAKQTAKEYTDQKVGEIVIDDASLTKKGIVQLSNATNGNRDYVAATESAVAAAFQLGVEQKSNVVAALNSIGVSASTSETWPQLINKITSIMRALGNATAAQVLAGISFSNSAGNGLVGVMPDRSGGSHNLATNTEVWAGDRVFLMAPEGYYNGSWVYALTPDLRPENIREGKDVLGVRGTLSEGVIYATGTITSQVSMITAVKNNGETVYRYPIIITGLAFRPNRIIVRDMTSNVIVFQYTTSSRGALPTAAGSDHNYFYEQMGVLNGSVFRINEYTASNGASLQQAMINDNTVKLPMPSAGTNYTWEAFRV